MATRSSINVLTACIAVLSLQVLTSGPVTADEIHVYEGESIQAAIDTASDGDEIIVHPGTYNENIDFRGKAFWLHSSDGPEVTIIDAGGGMGVSCSDDAGPHTVFDGFTVTGGNVWLNGGGMWIWGSSPTVMNCTFIANVASHDGGGMFITNGSPTVMNCKFIANNAAIAGGGMFIENGSPTVTDCLFLENTTLEGAGGGMSNRFDGTGDYSVTVTNCTFTANTAGGGGGIRNACWGNKGSSVTVTNCTFTANTAGG
ncbi:MAG: hypothetical protein JSV91_10030, partial [Phycisphaerales bacterium]